ncbi:MAG: hypothetical protein IJ526_01870 [Lachnospiraceae bacterium]|nr:hypothetical protein [Lachnospiraceae bacterium]
MDIGSLGGVVNTYQIRNEGTGSVTSRSSSIGNFGSTFVNAATKSKTGASAGIVLHGKNDANAGETAVGSWASVQTGVSTSVYKPDDFSDDNPYYHMKIWKPDGTMEERMVDVLNFNPKSEDSFDQYAFECYLDKEEGVPVWSHSMTELVDKEDDLYQKRDWIQAYKAKAQQLYDVKYYDGYMRYKMMYERLMEQIAKVGI